MKILTYNILFGMNGSSFKEAFKSHLAIHGPQPFIPIRWPLKWRKYFVGKRSIHLSDVIEIIKNSQADIVCLNEVLRGLHEKSL